MPVDVFVADEQSARPVDTHRWAEFARQVLLAQGIRHEAELSVIYVDEPTIAAHNRQFLGHEGPTDVLSFPIEDEPVVSGRSPDNGGPGPGTSDRVDEAPLLLGDVIICPAVAFRNAPEHAGTYEEELALLLVHGILHLLGMDHLVDSEAEKMEAREQQLLDAYFRTAPGAPAEQPTPGGAHG
jgi:probable rRNA maturation factor